ncbi:MAG TPA: universal stress protein [Chitinophagaceae bacterium]
MKTIIVATDFSPASRNAAAYAVHLARAFHSKLILLNAFVQPPVPVTKPFAIVDTHDLQEVVLQQLNNETEMLDPQAEQVIRVEARQGSAVHCVMEAVKEHHADLVVLGLKDENRIVKKLPGSTISGLMHSGHCPLLVVPEDARYNGVDTLTLAYEGDLYPDDDKHVADALLQLAHRFHSRLYLIHIAKTELQEVYQVFNKPLRLTRLMHTVQPVVETIRSASVPEAIDRFVKEHRVNILAMMPQKKTGLRRIFESSNTRNVTFRSSIPVLMLPGYHEGRNLWWSKRLRSKSAL